jgi:hypothetical protein
VALAPIVLKYQWQANLLHPGRALEGLFHVVFVWLGCRQWTHWWKLRQCHQGQYKCPLLAGLCTPLMSLLVWHSVLDTVARYWPPNTVCYWAYKIVVSDNVLMLGQHNKHWCHAVLSWHGLLDHSTPILWCPMAPKVFCCNQVCH